MIKLTKNKETIPKPILFINILKPNAQYLIGASGNLPQYQIMI